MATNSTNNQTVSISNSNTCKANEDVWSERCKIEPFNCRVVIAELAAVALAKHDLKVMCLLLSQISGPLADIRRNVGV